MTVANRELRLICMRFSRFALRRVSGVETAAFSSTKWRLFFCGAFSFSFDFDFRWWGKGGGAPRRIRFTVGWWPPFVSIFGEYLFFHFVFALSADRVGR